MDQNARERMNDAQVSIIGACLIQSDCVPSVMAVLSPGDFPQGTCKNCFAVMRQMLVEHKPIDPVTVLDTMGGGAELMEFIKTTMDLTPSCANVLEYCQILKSLSKLGKINTLAERLPEATTLDEATALVSRMAGLTVSSRAEAVPSIDMATAFYERMQSKEKPVYLKTGIPLVDKSTYMELGDMVGIGAEPSTGKTALGIQWALELSKTYRVGFFSLETNQKKIEDRVFAAMSTVTLGDIKKQEFNPEQWKSLADAANTFSTMSFEFVHAAGWTANDIVAYSVSRQYQVIFVDYLQLVVGDGKSSRYDIVTDASMVFHVGAQRHNILTVVLSQLRRPENVKGKPVKPTMHSFRESGQIEQDLDVALILYLSDPSDSKSNRMLRIAKNKEGYKAEVELLFDGGHQKFTEITPNIAGEYAAVGREIRREVSRKAHLEQARMTDFERLPDETEVPFF